MYLSTLKWLLKIVIKYPQKIVKIKKCTFRAHRILKSNNPNGFLHIFGLLTYAYPPKMPLSTPPKK